MRKVELILLFAALGVVGCMPIKLHASGENGAANTHMQRCHKELHHHNARNDHSAKCLSGDVSQ